MVHVQLDGEWTDGSGKSHSAGDMVDVDAATLAKLQKDGIVREGADQKESGATTAGWAGPGSAPR